MPCLPAPGGSTQRPPIFGTSTNRSPFLGEARRPAKLARCVSDKDTDVLSLGRQNCTLVQMVTPYSWMRGAGGFPPNVGSVSPQICVSSCIALFLSCIVSCPSSISFALVSRMCLMYFADSGDVYRPRATIHVHSVHDSNSIHHDTCEYMQIHANTCEYTRIHVNTCK